MRHPESVWQFVLLKISPGKVRKNPWSTAVLLFGFNFARDLQDSPFYDLNEKKGENIIRYNQERNLFQN